MVTVMQALSNHIFISVLFNFKYFKVQKEHRAAMRTVINKEGGNHMRAHDFLPLYLLLPPSAVFLHCSA